MAANEIVFVDGDTTFPNGNLTIGCRVQVTGNSLCTGNNIQPSILIINGNLTIQGTPNITGLIYVHGSVTVSGNVTIMGAMVVAGTTTSNTGGSMDVWFNSDALNDLSNLGKVTNTAGAWRDW